VTFRPITAETDELAWAKAHKYLALLQGTYGSGPKPAVGGLPSKPANGDANGTSGAASAYGNGNGDAKAGPRGHGARESEPQNVGSQRLLEIAARGEVQDRALWYPTVTATGARGASTALVGSYQTVIDSLVDYAELGCELLSIRGYDNFNDAVDYGRYILPGVRKALAEKGIA
jgi:alkanesulfonate monooxygenase